MKEKNLQLKISKYDQNGRGVAFMGTKPYFIDGVLKGELISYDPETHTVAEIITPSSARVEPPCGMSGRCGNCHFLYADYAEQLKIKKQMVTEALKDCADPSLISDVVGMHYPFKYRNKLHLAFAKAGEKIKIGFFEEHSNRVVDFKKCLLHDKFAEILTQILRRFVEKNKIKIYEKKGGQGLRYAAARYLDGSLMLTLVSTYSALPAADELYDELSKNFKEASLYLNVNRLDNSTVFSDKFIHLKGKPYIEGKLCGIKFEYHPAAFIQINDSIAAKIYNDIEKNSQADASTTILDIYSGIGITSVVFAGKGANVYSIELSRDAVKSAAALKKVYGLSEKITNICGDAGSELTKIALENDDMRAAVKAVNTIKSKNLRAETKPRKPDAPFTAALGKTAQAGYTSAPKHDKLVAFVDPPRTGLDEKVSKALLRLAPKRIIYLSCNPVTLGENLKRFVAAGYKIKYVAPYDMFPQTRHVETLAVLDAE